MGRSSSKLDEIAAQVQSPSDVAKVASSSTGNNNGESPVYDATPASNGSDQKRGNATFEPFDVYAFNAGVIRSEVSYVRDTDEDGTPYFRGFVEMTHVGEVQTAAGLRKRMWTSTMPLERQYGPQFVQLEKPVVATFDDGSKVLMDRRSHEADGRSGYSMSLLCVD